MGHDKKLSTPLLLQFVKSTFVLALLLGQGCSKRGDSVQWESTVSTNTTGIVWGKSVTSTQMDPIFDRAFNTFQSVGFQGNPNKSLQTCSAILITERHLLTNAHCFIPSGFSIKKGEKLYIDSRITLLLTANISSSMAIIPGKAVESVHFHPSLTYSARAKFGDKRNTLQEKTPATDLAIITLKKSVLNNQPSFSTKLFIIGVRHLREGMRFKSAGFGSTNIEMDLANLTFKRGFFPSLESLFVGPGRIGELKTFESSISKIQHSKPLFRTHLLRMGAGICFGDSGGPAYLTNGNTILLIGLNTAISRLGCSFGSQFFTYFDNATLNWIKLITEGEAQLIY